MRRGGVRRAGRRLAGGGDRARRPAARRGGLPGAALGPAAVARRAEWGKEEPHPGGAGRRHPIGSAGALLRGGAPAVWGGALSRLWRRSWSTARPRQCGAALFVLCHCDGAWVAFDKPAWARDFCQGSVTAPAVWPGHGPDLSPLVASALRQPADGGAGCGANGGGAAGRGSGRHALHRCGRRAGAAGAGRPAAACLQR